MDFEQVQTEARWAGEGRFSPRSFIWRGQAYTVESTGRQWETDRGLHVLCLVPGGQVFELVFRLNPAGWWGRPTAGARPARA